MIKKILLYIDLVFFGNAYSKAYEKNYKANQELKKFMKFSKYHYTVFYNKNNENKLSILCDKYGSDKGSIDFYGKNYTWAPHTYTDFYNNIFSHCRNHITKVFECGIGTNNPELSSSMGISAKPGASLRVWRDYFPSANIFGADIDEDILFSENRIETFYLDQTSRKSIEVMWEAINISAFDFIIDDGLHTFDAGVCLFENSIKNLSNSGIYVIEDVSPRDLIKYQKYFHKFSYTVEFVNLYRLKDKIGDNSLVVVHRK